MQNAKRVTQADNGRSLVIFFFPPPPVLPPRAPSERKYVLTGRVK